MAALHEGLRRALERQVIQARELAERGAEAALARLAVAAKEPHAHLTVEDRVLRNRLRAHARAIGDRLRANGGQEVDRLLEEVAYEAWHRMLFARFLAENQLLVHPEHGVAVSLIECDELAVEEGAEDKWVLASRYAARMLPQIFRPDDPALQVTFAPEYRISLEQLLEQLPHEVFTADDSLGWVYQFWQSERKKEVNAAGEPISGETLPAVTQLFTEPYMVSFLLENTIGARWTATHPDEPLPVEMPYMRRLQDATPAAGSFEGWPKDWRDFTLLDPCCGSGHFLVAALRILAPLRAHDEQLSVEEAVNAVLRENLYGLELDARCTQIAAFAVALAAWTTSGAKGYRPLPELQIACSGLSVAAKKAEWLRLAEGNQRLEGALDRLYELFKLAPEIGSLIDPTQGGDDLLTAGFREVNPLLQKALAQRTQYDDQLEATAVTAQGIAKAADLLARKYTFVVTNVPYLGRGKQGAAMRDFADDFYRDAREDLATIFLARCRRQLHPRGSMALVTPQSWLYQDAYKRLRARLLQEMRWNIVANLGAGAFDGISGEVVNVVLLSLSEQKADETRSIVTLDVSAGISASHKASLLRDSDAHSIRQSRQLANPDSRFTFVSLSTGALLREVASAFEGLSTGDLRRLRRVFWETGAINDGWVRFQGTVDVTTIYGGRDGLLLWCDGGDPIASVPGARKIGREAWERRGIAVSQMGSLPITLFTGEIFDDSTAVLIPRNPADLPALWAYCSSPTFREEVRRIDRALKVTSKSLIKVPFDLLRWKKEAEERYPKGFPAPHSNDPTQWLFRGEVPTSTTPLQIAVARLLGYRWPDQPTDQTVDTFCDTDGIACLPAVRGEMPADSRLQSLLAAAYGKQWSPATRDRLLTGVGFAGKTLGDWIRDGFFEQHTKLFHHRPFIWHISDRVKGGFSALVNYHKLDRKNLESLTYNYLGDWIARQEEARKRNERGADVRLAAAKSLQEELELILEGEPPYDVFVRWKPLDEQPIGWEPDLNDGVRVNIWPFVQAGVLRSKVNVNWNKDRGKNPEGSYWGENRYNRYEDIPPDERPSALRNVDELTNDIKRRARADRDKGAQPKSAKKPPATRR